MPIARPALLVSTALIVGGTLVSLAPAAVATAPAQASTTIPRTTVTIDGRLPGLPFQGVGAISGGGGNSRLLIDYPARQRSRILDYLFKPGYGASLQMLKLEIGADTNSSDGAEASMEHVRGAVDCQSGYEWWLAHEALARNPRIKIYALQWAAPGWVGEGGATLWTQSDIGYVVDWLKCAQSHGLTISYLGGWNEHGWSTTWYEEMRAALDSNGFGNVELVAADNAPSSPTGSAPVRTPVASGALPGQNVANAWAVADAMAADPQFDAVAGVVGAHDTCGYPTTGDPCESTQTAQSLGKPVWATELGRLNANSGAAPMARAINNGFIQAQMTGFYEWPLMESMPAGMPHQHRGLVTADQPWSGHFTVNRIAWAIAQTTQFTRPGWLHAAGASGPLAGGGSFDTYMSPDRSNWSMVAQTTHAAGKPGVAATQVVKVAVKGGLKRRTVRVWRTNLNSTDPSTWFARLANVYPTRGKFSYRLHRGYVYSFTTTSGQGKGAAGSPAAKQLALPYRDAFQVLTPPEGNEPRLLASQDGMFEFAPCADGQSLCVTQVAMGTPVFWGMPATSPYAVIGDTWANYQVSADVLFTQQQSAAGVIGRFAGRGKSGLGTLFDGYEFVVSDTGDWSVIRNSRTAGPVVLASGQRDPLPIGTWHRVGLSMSGASLTATLDGVRVASLSDASYPAGLVGIMTSGYYPVQFRNLDIGNVFKAVPAQSAP